MSASLFRRIGAALALLVLGLGLAACSNFVKAGDNRHNQPLADATVQGLRAMGSSPGQAMVVRIFKDEKKLEIWKKTDSGIYKFFKSYEICAYSGDYGPKVKEGDRQSPEGFYTITPGLMNPKSNYYLAFNTGFPNKFDRVNGRTGSNLMVHGDCSSRGCYAMTDAGIAEIYALARESFRGGNASFQLQIFPFRLTPTNLAAHASSPDLAFWKNIKPGYDYFELTKTPPVWDVCQKQYIFNPATNQPLDAAGLCPATVQNAALTAKLAADETEFTNKATAAQKAEARQVAETTAIKEREAAMSGFFTGIGSGIGGLFGMGGAPAQDTNVQPVISGQPATLPTSAAQRP